MPTQVSFFGFQMFGVNVLLNGTPTTADITFYQPGMGGGFDLSSPGLIGSIFDIYAPGGQLYTGSNAAPTFSLSSFSTTAGFPGTLGTGTLTISAVPEPDNWALLIAGFGLIGAIAHRRRMVAAA